MELTRTRLADIPAPFLDLAWQRFFIDSGRGVSLSAHFPWLRQGSAEDVALLAFASGAPAGMLVVRSGRLIAPGRGLKIAGIGLVCTAHGKEGQGIASGLVRTALAAARESGFDAALLWTNKHEFYHGLGFVAADNASMGPFERPPATADPRLEFASLGDSPLSAGKVFAGPRGIPPFARQVDVVAAPGISARVALVPGEQPTIVGWSGAGDQVAEIVNRLGASALRLNDKGERTIAAALSRSGWSGTMDPVNLAMWHPLGDRCPDPQVLGRIEIDLLDRF